MNEEEKVISDYLKLVEEKDLKDPQVFADAVNGLALLTLAAMGML